METSVKQFYQERQGTLCEFFDEDIENSIITWSFHILDIFSYRFYFVQISSPRVIKNIFPRENIQIITSNLILNRTSKTQTEIMRTLKLLSKFLSFLRISD